MGFGGSTRGAQVSLKNNRREKSSKTEKYLKTTGSRIGGINSHRTSSPEELEQLRQKLLSENRKRNRSTYLVTAVIFGIFLFLFLYFMF